MMPVIRITDNTTRDLQRVSEPLVDNFDSVISRMVKAALDGVPYKIPDTAAAAVLKSGMATSPTTSAPPSATGVAPHDDLTHTRLRFASFGGVEIPKANWNSLVKHAHIKAYEVLGSFEALKMVSQAHLRKGKYDGEGFVYLGSIDVSIQGMDSNMSWDNSVRLARKIGVPIEVTFEWYNKPNAAHPGQTRTLKA